MKNFMEKSNLFSDNVDGFYHSYGLLGGANGFYIFPKYLMDSERHYNNITE